MAQTLLKNGKYEIWGSDGWEDFDGLLITEEQDIKVRKFKTSGNKWIECTESHRLYNKLDKEVTAGSLSLGDHIQTENGLDTIIEIKERTVDIVYDVWNSKTHKIYTNGIKNHQCDEFSFVPQGQADAFWAANYPALAASTESKLIIVSTPNGMFNLFHQLYTAAEKGLNTFAHYKADWRAIPGRDAKWAEIQRKNLGEMRFAQEFDVQFLGSSNTVINVDILKNLFETVKSEPDIVDLNERLKIYERPIKGATYILGVDPSKGVGKDDSVVQILKVDNLDPIHVSQVAVFKDNKTDTYEFSELVNRLSYYYNNARIFIENNAEGAPVVSHLWWTYENMNLYSHGSDPGIRASKSTKTKAVLLMKRLLESYQLDLRDSETVKQLGSFIENKGKFYGKDLPDDLVSGLYWACYAFEAKDVFDTTPNVINKKDEDDDVWGILSDATEPEEDWKWLTSPF